MSTATELAAPGPAPRPAATRASAPRDDLSRPVSLGRAISSEWIKFRTLRSTLAVLAAAVIGMLVISLAVAYNTRHLSSNLQPDDVVASSTLQGYYLAQLLIGALGVLFVTGEYSTGMIRATLVAVPRRLPVLWAKLVVFVTVTLVSMVIMSIVSFLVSQAVISHYRTGFSLGDPGVLRVVLGTGVYLALVGVIGAALGWIVRSTPGALVAYVALLLVVPTLLSGVLGHLGRTLAEYFPSNAGGAVLRSLPEANSLSVGAGAVVVVAWAVVLVAFAVVSLRRRDA